MNQWNNDQLKRLSEYRDEFEVFSIMHNRAAAYCSRWSKWLSTPSIALGTCATGAAFMLNVPYLSGVCALASTIIMSVEKLYKFEERHSNHTGASDAHRMLFMDLDSVLLSNEKPSFDVYFPQLVTKYKQLTKSSPIIPEAVLEKYLLDVSTQTKKVFGFGIDDVTKESVDTVLNVADRYDDPDEEFYQNWERKRKRKKRAEQNTIRKITQIRQKVSNSMNEGKDDV